MAPLIGGLGAVFGGMLRRSSTQVQDELAGALTVASEVLQSIREVKSFGREPYERERFSGAVQRAFKIALAILRLRAFVGSLVGLHRLRRDGGDPVVRRARGAGGSADRRRTDRLPDLRRQHRGKPRLAAQPVHLVRAGDSARPSASSKSSTSSRKSSTRPTRRPSGASKGASRLSTSPSATTTRQEVLHDIDLDIAPGEILALVGPSGAGKSTIFNLIPRFYDPTSGSVCMDGVDLRQVTQKSLRDQIAVVPQETLLFGGTIYENIRYGRLEASEAEIIEAAKAANAHDFIMELPDQYQTIVGERGIRLSGGQRQRVAIARALLKDPRMLLLDEATSSLDSESEHEVQDALARLMQGRTTVIIAHRLSTVRIAHRIAVLEKGSIIELGSHDELMARNGLYARLYAMQFREELIEERCLPTRRKPPNSAA